MSRKLAASEFKNVNLFRIAKQRKAGATRERISRVIVNLAEKKFIDKSFSLVSGAWDYNGSIVSLSDTVVGTTDSTRIGDKIRGLSIDLKMNLYVGTVNSTCRVIVFRWKPRHAINAPTPGGVIKSGFVGTVHAPIGAFDHDNRHQFQVLLDRTYSMGSGGDSVHKVRARIALKNKKVNYFGGSSTDCTDGIYMLAINDNAAAAAAPTVYGVTRLNYMDL